MQVLERRLLREVRAIGVTVTNGQVMRSGSVPNGTLALADAGQEAAEHTMVSGGYNERTFP